MTATDLRRTAKAYRGVVYGIDVIDHKTGMVVEDDYVGQTRQRGRLRELQHRDRQPFSDRIAGDAHVLWEGICTDDELDEMERHFIQDVAVRPRLNVKMNEDNPHAIPKQVQIAQRHARDRARRRDLWVPFEQRQRQSLLEWETPDRLSPSRNGSATSTGASAWQFESWEIKLALWIAGWLFSMLVVWGCLCGWGIRPYVALWVSAVACAAILGLSLLVPPRKRRRRRRSR